MCLCGLKASPLFCLCGITLGSCPLPDPTVFMRKTTGGLYPPLLLPSTFFYALVLLHSSVFISFFALLHPPSLILSSFLCPRSLFGSSFRFVTVFSFARSVLPSFLHLFFLLLSSILGSPVVLAPTYFRTSLVCPLLFSLLPYFTL